VLLFLNPQRRRRRLSRRPRPCPIRELGGSGSPSHVLDHPPPLTSHSLLNTPSSLHTAPRPERAGPHPVPGAEVAGDAPGARVWDQSVVKEKGRWNGGWMDGQTSLPTRAGCVCLLFFPCLFFFSCLFTSARRHRAAWRRERWSCNACALLCVGGINGLMRGERGRKKKARARSSSHFSSLPLSFPHTPNHDLHPPHAGPPWYVEATAGRRGRGGGVIGPPQGLILAH